jgi:hypothetical protein
VEKVGNGIGMNEMDENELLLLSGERRRRSIFPLPILGDVIEPC